jgi:hypothetical protein
LALRVVEVDLGEHLEQHRPVLYSESVVEGHLVHLNQRLDSKQHHLQAHPLVAVALAAAQ